MVAVQIQASLLAGRTAVVSRPRTNASTVSRPALMRSRRTVVRAEGTPVEKVEETPVVATTVTPTPVTPTPVPAPAPARPGIGEAMAFSGAPEIINGRLAMLAFVAALGAELATGRTVTSQFVSAPILIVATAVLFSWASLVPYLKGEKNTEGLGPFTPSAELLNGRAAMLGFAALLVIEGVKHTALF